MGVHQEIHLASLSPSLRFGQRCNKVYRGELGFAIAIFPTLSLQISPGCLDFSVSMTGAP